MLSRRTERERDMVMRLSVSSLLKRRNGTSSQKHSLCPRRFYNRHLLQLRLQQVSILQLWEECPPSVHLHRASPVGLHLPVEVRRHTMPEFRPPEPLQEAPFLYHQLPQVCLRDPHNHRLDTPTQPISTQAVSDHPPGLRRRASQLLP